VLVALMMAGLALIFLSNAYYPFRDFDALARYAYEARLIYETGGLPAELTGFPQLVQMNYAYAFLAFGGLVEWAARLAPSLMAAGAVGAAVALGCALLDEQVGLWGGLLLLLTPIFARWATSGYIDVPLAFMLAMAALALYRWWQRKTPSRAAWAGLWLGLALWTKQSALLHLGGAGLFVGLSIVEGRGWRERGRWLAILRDGLLMLGAALLVAGPWYARNYALGGLANVVWSPGTYATGRADPRLGNLIPFPAHPDWFGVALSFVYAAGVLVMLSVALGVFRRPQGETWGTRLLACLTLPHMLVWWQRYSYNPRHLLPLLPLAAVMATYALRLALGSVEARGRLAAGAALLLAAGLVWPAGLRYYVFAPYRLLQGAGGDVEARRMEALGDSYRLVHVIQREVPPGSGVYTMDGRMSFYLSGYRVASGSYPGQWEELAGYDYLVSAPWGPDLYRALGQEDSPVFAALSGGDPHLEIVSRAGGFALYRIHEE
jgi:4-amino-4-deoxy-L-arabinose transferase-like glycosyltransferase